MINKCGKKTSVKDTHKLPRSRFEKKRNRDENSPKRKPIKKC